MNQSTDNPYASPAEEPDVVLPTTAFQFNAAGSWALLITIVHCMALFVSVEWLLGVDQVFAQNPGVFPRWINAARVVVPLMGFYGSLVMTGLCLVYRVPFWLLVTYWQSWTAVYSAWFYNVLTLAGTDARFPLRLTAVGICLSSIGVSLWIHRLATVNRQQSQDDAIADASSVE